jgi:hypothetical protein
MKCQAIESQPFDSRPDPPTALRTSAPPGLPLTRTQAEGLRVDPERPLTHRPEVRGLARRRMGQVKIDSAKT